ncbi:hypothetical protein ILYODFUR_033652 [Ilyodon furcidens]|uniref:Uncharacterized protein n=1 Tax=Ilyodon furcidens TaxID=33524 RepID=A0ABV0UEK6_9TELE
MTASLLPSWFYSPSVTATWPVSACATDQSKKLTKHTSYFARTISQKVEDEQSEVDGVVLLVEWGNLCAIFKPGPLITICVPRCGSFLNFEHFQFSQSAN